LAAGLEVGKLLSRVAQDSCNRFFGKNLPTSGCQGNYWVP